VLRPTGRGGSYGTRPAIGIGDVSPEGNGDLGQGSGGVGHRRHRRQLVGPIVHPEHVGEQVELMDLLSAALTSGGLQKLVGEAYQLLTCDARDGAVAHPGLEDRDQLTHCRLNGHVRPRRIGLDGPLPGSSRVPRSGSWRARTGARRNQHAEGDETCYRCYRDETGLAIHRSPVIPPARRRAHHVACERGWSLLGAVLG
jgi:hypothetical protein